jgi:hypothetical protein
MKMLLRSGLTLLVAVLVGCAGAGGGATTPSAAQNVRSLGVSGGNLIIQKLAIHPATNAPPILMNFVSDGPAQGGVPCINCVNGASSSDNIGLTGPSSYIPTGATWMYTLSFTDISYKGKCTLAWTIVAGKKTIDKFSATLDLTSAGGFVLYALDRTRPNYSGPATLTGKATCGKNAPSMKAPLQFE